MELITLNCTNSERQFGPLLMGQFNGNTKQQQIQAEAKTSKTIIQHHLAQGTKFIRRYLQQSEIVTFSLSEHQRIFLIQGLWRDDKKPKN